MDNEREHAELNKNKWDLRSATFDKGRFDYFRFMQKRVISLLDLKENDSFLDVGCGTGWAVRYAASLVKNKGKFHGIDISSKMIEKAEEDSRGCENIYFCQANAEALPFEDDFFHFIICTNSFHHYYNPSKVLDEFYRVLKPGGKTYIMDLTADGVITRMFDKWVKKREKEHVKFYSTKDYRALFARAKLDYVSGKLVWVPMKVHVGGKL